MKGHSGASATDEGFVLDDGRETIGTTPLDAIPDVILRMPGDSLAPLLLSLTLTAVFVGLLVQSWWTFGLALGASLVATVVWLWPEAKLGQMMDIARV